MSIAPAASSRDSGVADDSPGDIVAIFHCSFHPTKGHHIDWARKTDDALDLEGVEFNALPSGLHVVEEDIIHFTKESYHGVCVFLRHETGQMGMRGYHLRSLGILCSQSPRPRPWRHIPHLRRMIRDASPQEEKWSEVEAYFDCKKAIVHLPDDASWDGWENEYTDELMLNHPVIPFRSLIRSFGPFFYTLYKHVVGGRRVLLYTEPPVELACVFAQVISDLCQVPRADFQPTTETLGLVTLSDIDRLRRSSRRGWIACTTDKIFFDKTDLYDMIVDMSKISRPVLYISHRRPRWYESSRSRPRLHHARFTWSDVTSWNELDHAVGEMDEKASQPIHSRPRWSDISGVYDDACELLAKLWLSNSKSSGKLSVPGSFRQDILEAFQWRTSFLLSTLDRLTSSAQSPESSTITLHPNALLEFELGPLSYSDARFVEWLGERNGRKIEIRRNWRELVCVALGL